MKKTCAFCYVRTIATVGLMLSLVFVAWVGMQVKNSLDKMGQQIQECGQEMKKINTFIEDSSDSLGRLNEIVGLLK